MNKLYILAAIFLLVSQHAMPQGRHPGVSGEDAPDGQVARILSDDIEIHGVLYYPEERSGQLPGVVLVHGWSPYGTRAGEPYTYAAKEYAQNGFIALAITLRGWPETGGVDDCGLRQPEDVLKAAQWLSEQPGVNPEKIALMGQSLGGQVVLSTAALSDLIKATVSYFPITDFRLWGVTTNLPQIKEDYIYGLCTEDGTPEDRSPIYTSNEITGSVLLLHGDNDQNVVITHSELMYQKMLESEQDVTLYTAIGGGHGSGGPGWENHNEVVYNFLREKMAE